MVRRSVWLQLRNAATVSEKRRAWFTSAAADFVCVVGSSSFAVDGPVRWLSDRAMAGDHFIGEDGAAEAVDERGRGWWEKEMWDK